MCNPGILLDLLLLVAIALTPACRRPRCLSLCARAFARDVSVLIRPTEGDTLLTAETGGLASFSCNVESTLSACFAINPNPAKAIEWPAGRARMPPNQYAQHSWPSPFAWAADLDGMLPSSNSTLFGRLTYALAGLDPAHSTGSSSTGLIK
jgi:hypothetical protein